MDDETARKIAADVAAIRTYAYVIAVFVVGAILLGGFALLLAGLD